MSLNGAKTATETLKKSEAWTTMTRRHVRLVLRYVGKYSANRCTSGLQSVVAP